MHILTVYAHPEPKSFNYALASVIAEEAEKKGHTHTLRDLYALNFQPVLTARDFEDFNHNIIPPDITAEQNEVAKANIIAFVHPVWWFSHPAILKGWIDKVFSYGFAYGHDSKGVRGLLTGKKTVIINTTGGDEKSGYIDTGFKNAMLSLSDNGIYQFVGLEVALRRIYYQVPTQSQEGRVAMLEDLRAALRSIL